MKMGPFLETKMRCVCVCMFECAFYTFTAEGPFYEDKDEDRVCVCFCVCVCVCLCLRAPLIFTEEGPFFDE